MTQTQQQTEPGSPEWVRAQRRHLGITQAVLARSLEVQVITVSRWETGRRQPGRYAVRAIEALVRRNDSRALRARKAALAAAAQERNKQP